MVKRQRLIFHKEINLFLRVMKIIHETMKTLKKITFGRVLGLIAVLCVCWVSILVSVEFYAARKSSEYLGDIYSSECHSYIKMGNIGLRIWLQENYDPRY